VLVGVAVAANVGVATGLGVLQADKARLSRHTTERLSRIRALL
jgi:hypothetical protein